MTDSLKFLKLNFELSYLNAIYFTLNDSFRAFRKFFYK